MDGAARSGTIQLASNRTYDVVVARPGFKTLRQQSMRPAPQWNFTLEPEPLRLSFSTSEKEGQVFIDNNEKGALQNGLLQNLELPTDGNEHVLALRKGNREIVAFSFTAKPAETARVIGLKPRDAIVVSSLGAEAIVYSGGSPGLRANLSGQEQQPIPPDGLKLTAVTSANNELAFSNNDLAKIAVDVGNAPALYVALNADTNIAYATVQMNVPAAHLFVDGVEIKPLKPGTWRPIARKPGKYTILGTADGYEDNQQQVELVKDKPAKIAPGTEAQSRDYDRHLLIVEGGTPGAEFLIDGMPVKALDGNGSARVEIPPGPHQVAFRKDLFEPSAERQITLSRGQETKLGASDAKLKEFGAIRVKTVPADAQVTYRHGDQTGRLRGGSGPLPEGRYSITVEAPGYRPQTKKPT